MHYKFLCQFLLDIGQPLQGGEEENLWNVAKIASSFCDHYGYIQYNQLIYELFRVKFHADFFKKVVMILSNKLSNLIKKCNYVQGIIEKIDLLKDLILVLLFNQKLTLIFFMIILLS